MLLPLHDRKHNTPLASDSSAQIFCGSRPHNSVMYYCSTQDYIKVRLSERTLLTLNLHRPPRPLAVEPLNLPPASGVQQSPGAVAQIALPQCRTETATRLILTRFPSSQLIMRVPFFLLFSFNKETPKSKGQKGTTGVPS